MLWNDFWSLTIPSYLGARHSFGDDGCILQNKIGMGQLMRFQYLSHIRDTICCDSPKSAYTISSFPPHGYLPAMNDDNRKSCILN